MAVDWPGAKDVSRAVACVQPHDTRHTGDVNRLVGLVGDQKIVSQRWTSRHKPEILALFVEQPVSPCGGGDWRDRHQPRGQNDIETQHDEMTFPCNPGPRPSDMDHQREYGWLTTNAAHYIFAPSPSMSNDLKRKLLSFANQFSQP